MSFENPIDKHLEMALFSTRSSELACSGAVKFGEISFFSADNAASTGIEVLLEASPLNAMEIGRLYVDCIPRPLAFLAGTNFNFYFAIRHES